MPQVALTLPAAFSVRDYHEFQAHRDALQQMNPGFCVDEVATGRHVNGGPTVFWGIIHLKDDTPDEPTTREALHSAGFDFTHNGKFTKPEA